jgi:uncharacterized protein YbaP (TraB family)
MFSRSFKRTFLYYALAVFYFGTARQTEAASVWKVTGSNGSTLYLGGSVHGLESTDYPLPSAFNRAFDLSSRIVFEDDGKVSPNTIKRFLKSGEYPKNDNLKNHIDPRVYDYLRRVFAVWNVPEADFSKLRPWALVMWFSSLGTNSLGVEFYLKGRADANHKPIDGLESFREHAEIISGLNDHQAQLALLIGFIPQASGSERSKKIIAAWRAGDVDTIARDLQNSFRDLPSFYQRLIVDRNRNWIPKIERYLSRRETCFVVAGAGHMGGPAGVLALLKARGYTIEQL